MISKRHLLFCSMFFLTGCSLFSETEEIDLRPACGTCAELEVACGETVNACGETLDCGPCEDLGTCVPETDGEFCSRQAKDCAIVQGPDNCERARSVNCGQCPNGYVCGRREENVCDCDVLLASEICENLGTQCGTIETMSCGEIIEVNCDSCPDGRSCAMDNTCCTADPDEAEAICRELEYECGANTGPRGCPIECGSCSDGMMCGADSKCACDPNLCSNQICDALRCCAASCIEAVFLGARHACDLKSIGSVSCWGDGSRAQTGDGPTADVFPPVELSLARVTGVAAGSAHTCAIVGKEIRCWGDNTQSQIGAGFEQIVESPATVFVGPAAESAPAVQAGGETTCLRTQSGTLKCWGDNEFGQCGDGTKDDIVNSPTVVAELPRAFALSVGKNHTCAIHEIDGLVMAGTVNQVSCWGDNSTGQLGPNVTATSRNLPELMPLGVNGASGISNGDGFTCVEVVNSRNQILCWGSNSYGQLGNADTVEARPQPQPVIFDFNVYRPCRKNDAIFPVGGGSCVTEIAAGARHVCMLDGFQRVACWGQASEGALGRELQEEYSPVPTKIALRSPALSISSGDGFSCAALVDGGTACWGKNNRGQLGRTDTSNGIGDVIYFP